MFKSVKGRLRIKLCTGVKKMVLSLFNFSLSLKFLKYYFFFGKIKTEIRAS